ncbi:AGAP005498-PA-like protein [Anopheles sinensis]|uniref:Phospholipid scramblase n=1 Tax=Anopheles sinensis TaxID=74873 RepID=A0A084W2Y3_ANOSI|nr:AGAP005498-PA-like protein [Anopheles sinensis]
MSISPKEIANEENQSQSGGNQQDPSVEQDANNPPLQPNVVLQPPAPTPSGMNPPITTQPSTEMQPAGLMTMPQAIPQCPPGLENLYGTGGLVVHLESPVTMVGPNELMNKYNIKNALGNLVYRAEELANIATRKRYGPLREFDIKVLDNFQNEVLHFRRDHKRCACCCFPWGLQKVDVSLQSGAMVGTIQQRQTLWNVEFDIKDQYGQTVLAIRNTTPFGRLSFTADAIYFIFGMDGTEIGKLTKKCVAQKFQEPFHARSHQA